MRILLAIDGSAHSQTAVDEIARRPWPPKSTIRVMSVIQPHTPPATEFVLAGATLDDVRRQQASTAEQLTGHAADALTQTGLATETAVREGDPRAAIVDEVEEWGADLIVVGSHGRTGLTRWLLGSVAQAVVGHAPCSGNTETIERPLASIRPQFAARRITRIEIRFQEDARAREPIQIDEPTSVRVDETPDGVARGLEIVDEHGECTRIRFRAPLPETLDGIAPGELPSS